MRRIEAIPLSEATKGLCICADVLDAEGNILLAEGALLTDESIATLRAKEVSHIVAVTDRELSREELLALEKEIQARLDHLFRGAEDTPRRKELQSMIMDFRMGRLTP